jgi:hypothetical protein
MYKKPVEKMIKQAYSNSYNKKHSCFVQEVFEKCINEIVKKYQSDNSVSENELLVYINEVIEKIGAPKVKKGKIHKM